MTDAAKLRTAYHEAAHAVVAELLGVPVGVVSVRPAQPHMGVTIHASVRFDDEVTEILARRRGKNLLARWGAVPYPLFASEERWRAEVSIMIALAGHMGEFLMPEFTPGGYRDDTADIDQEQAISAAVGLTAEQSAWLDEAEQRDARPNDDDAAFEAARWNTGQEAAGALVHYLSWETRRLVFSPLVQSLVPPVVDQLLRHEVIPGETVREIVQRITGETLKHEEATTMVRAAAKQEDPSAISEDTPLSRLMICMRGVTWSRAGSCPEGTIVLDTDPRVVEAPEAFRPLSEHLSVSVPADAHG